MPSQQPKGNSTKVSALNIGPTALSSSGTLGRWVGLSTTGLDPEGTVGTGHGGYGD